METIMFVQYSFVDRHEYPGFKTEPSRLGPWRFVVGGLIAMVGAAALYLAL
jgi:hypothetical protein